MTTQRNEIITQENEMTTQEEPKEEEKPKPSAFDESMNTEIETVEEDLNKENPTMEEIQDTSILSEQETQTEAFDMLGIRKY